MNQETNLSVQPLPTFLVRYRMALVVGAHGVLFTLALLAAFLLAYNFRWQVQHQGEARSWFFDLYPWLLVLALPMKLLVFHWTKQYRGSWRYVGLRDLFGVISASLVGTFLFLSAYFLLENGWNAVTGHPLIHAAPHQYLNQSSVFALDWACTIAFVCAARILVRFYYEDIQPQRTINPNRILIVGAADTGEAVLREILRMRQERYHCVGFLDDDVAHLHGRIHDVEVLGRIDDVREICERLDVKEVWIALPHASPKMIRGLVGRCEGTTVLFRTIPAVSDVVEGRVKVSQIRDVDIADLLGRRAVQLDVDKIGSALRDKRVLVTGAGGSIGAEMCRQIAAFTPQRLILLERAENSLFEIHRELREKHPTIDIVPYVADITDRPRLHAILERETPSMVFHAAAHKHVPMMEINPGEAIKNNIGGTMAVAEAALKAGVGKMVVVSTDKAVKPTSLMGCTKRVAELFVQSLTDSGVTQFVTVRFGNVLGSSGSVVPIFKDQIARGGPITVTHADMTRYFMTITEAAQLVLQAGVMGKGGEIYMLHMGDPIRIVDLARDMITLSGLRPGVDIEIVFTGKRPGEKLFEELANEGENVEETTHPKIGIWKQRPADLGGLRAAVERLIQMADSAPSRLLKTELKRLVPEYTPDEDSTEASRNDPAESPNREIARSARS